MSAGGSIAAMIASMKNNSRRKNKHIPFSKNSSKHKKGKAIQSKEFSQLEKDLLLKELKENRELENKQRVYKMIISFGLTIVVVSSIVFAIKFIFF